MPKNIDSKKDEMTRARTDISASFAEAIPTRTGRWRHLLEASWLTFFEGLEIRLLRTILSPWVSLLLSRNMVL
jgi:hypothetical protein